MKKLLLISFCFMTALAMQGQKLDFWLDAGVKVQTGFTTLYNANTSQGNKWDFTTATGTKYGGKFGFNWGNIGVTLDVLLGKHKAQFQEIDTSPQFVREISVSSTDLYLLFRSARHKGYFEIGPKMSLIGDIRDNEDTRDLNDLYETRNLAGVLGFGTYMLGPEGGRFSGILGFRLEYGFQDIVNDAGRGTEVARQPVAYEGEAETTHPIFAGIVFELNWGIGGVGQARCGERSKFVWF